jgi:hypothetical protein
VVISSIIILGSDLDRVTMNNNNYETIEGVDPMKKPRYVKPQSRALDRMLAVSIGGCSTGSTPGTCGLPGYHAGTCNPTGDAEGTGPTCLSTGFFAQGGCSTGQWAN